jgi:hypothetical protein
MSITLVVGQYQRNILLDYQQQDIYNHCPSLTGTAELTLVAPTGPVPNFKLRPYFLREEPPILAHFFTSQSNSSSSQVIHPTKRPLTDLPTMHPH